MDQVIDVEGAALGPQILHPDPDGHEPPGQIRRPHCCQLVSNGIDRAGLADQGYCRQHLLQPALGICIFKHLKLVGHKFLKHGFMIQLPGSRHAVGTGRSQSLVSQEPGLEMVPQILFHIHIAVKAKLSRKPEDRHLCDPQGVCHFPQRIKAGLIGIFIHIICDPLLYRAQFPVFLIYRLQKTHGSSSHLSVL